MAHIVGAEKGGPRGGGPETAEERRAFDNLVLMCATHGREVDSPETGEKFFPIEKMRALKAAHETKVSEAVMAAVEEELTGVRTATGLLDISLRPSNGASTAAGLAESMMFTDDRSRKSLLAALEEARSCLERLSQPALDMLAQFLAVWLVTSRDDKTRKYDFGDPGDASVRLPIATIENRVKHGMDQTFGETTQELTTHGLLSLDIDDYDQDYVVKDPWNLMMENFWVCTASFLYEAFGVEVQDWLRTLDFTIFDRLAPADSGVPWR
ncbi:hypothetical protein [Nocardioides sp.]|uniref:hypothetical protein n=1 Tax=Nocardioides sp. TaxID=35761 RepID=UPI001A1EE184|nr:hypothetical protein [Nocardioides sp.]MBJ7356863.1 hypothetical protein [Nocardioides sp.]